jgi:hypothetical protein
MAKIAVLGWGSLIWEKHPEFDDKHDAWILDGPVLELEFSRISNTRDGALTLVIDDTNGAACTVSYALSKRTDPHDAICDLRSREGTILRNIGRYFEDGSSPSTEVPEEFKAWVRKKKLDVVVWTNLESNFKGTSDAGEEFSVSAALSHLKSLAPKGKARAAEYIWNAPPFVQTPLRAALEQEPWFKPHGAQSSDRI